MEAVIAFVQEWGTFGIVLVGVILWIARVERNLNRHEDRCSERYGLIFSELRGIAEKVARIDERTSK